MEMIPVHPTLCQELRFVDLRLIRSFATLVNLCNGMPGAGRLGRAATAGPRAYARLALFPLDARRDPNPTASPADALRAAIAPALRTPLQPLGFCPEFAARREFPLLLDARCMRALATQVRQKDLSCVHFLGNDVS